MALVEVDGMASATRQSQRAPAPRDPRELPVQRGAASPPASMWTVPRDPDTPNALPYFGPQMRYGLRKSDLGGSMSAQPERHDVGGRRVVGAEGAPERLAELGLTKDGIHASITVGDSARQRVTGRHYPRNYAGFAMWAETLAELRRQLIKVRQGWRIGYSGNYETVFSQERNFAIAVVGGDKFTGIQGTRDPRLTRKRGKRTTERLDRNRVLGQLELGLELPDNSDELAPDEACETWFLVVHPLEDEVRIELSLPKKVGDDGLVGEWTERILIDPIAVSGAVAPIESFDDGDDDGGDLVTRH